MSGPRRSPARRVADWWNLRRGRLDRILARFDPLGGPGDDPPAGVREPRRPRSPHLSGAATLELPPD
jgi:hypothetical protein